MQNLLLFDCPQLRFWSFNVICFFKSTNGTMIQEESMQIRGFQILRGGIIGLIWNFTDIFQLWHDIWFNKSWSLEMDHFIPSLMGTGYVWYCLSWERGHTTVRYFFFGKGMGRGAISQIDLFLCLEIQVTDMPCARHFYGELKELSDISRLLTAFAQFQEENVL